MSVEYKCVGAPERAKRKRGMKTRSDRVAGAMQEIIAAEAVDGWEYLRTDLVPVEEKAGLFGRAREVHRAVLVFHRGHAQVQPVLLPSLAPQRAAEEPRLEEPRLDVPPAEPPQPADPQADSNDRFRLAADTSEPASPQQSPSPRAVRTTPAGLG